MPKNVDLSKREADVAVRAVLPGVSPPDRSHG
jgi:hypothetical protein